MKELEHFTNIARSWFTLHDSKWQFPETNTKFFIFN
jgi:hypothetical protein